MLTAEECGRRLRAAREGAGLSLADAARRLDMRSQSYGQYERGDRVPSWAKLHEIVQTLGLDPVLIAPEWFDAKKGARKK